MLGLGLFSIHPCFARWITFSCDYMVVLDYFGSYFIALNFTGLHSIVFDGIGTILDVFLFVLIILLIAKLVGRKIVLIFCCIIGY